MLSWTNCPYLYTSKNACSITRRKSHWCICTTALIGHVP